MSGCPQWAEAFLFRTTARRRLRSIELVFDLLVGVRPPTGSEVQQGPHRLDRSYMSWILSRLRRQEKKLGGPAQPNHPIGAFVEYSEDRHLLALFILADRKSTRLNSS